MLDPFVGSGTTAVAAKLNGRRYLGIDIEAEHVQTANKRLLDLEAKMYSEFVQTATDRLADLEMQV